MRILVGALALAAVALGAAPALSAPITIPIAMVNGHIEIPVTFNGQPMSALLDSGAANSEIDLGLARRSGLKIEPPEPDPDSPPRAAPQPSLPAPGWLMDARGVLSVGGWTSPEPVWVDDLTPMAAMGQPAMIIGDDLFRAFVVELDFDAATLVLHDRAEFQPPPGASLLPVEHASFGYATPIEIEGRSAVRANLDLGANASLMLGHAYAQKLGVLGRPGATARGCLGVLGEQGCQTGLSVGEVRLGGLAFPGVPVVIPAAGDPVFRDIDANLGLGLLSRFHIWMDLSGGKLWLAPTVHMADPYKRTLGCAFRAEGEALVAVGVVTGGPAAAEGLKAGDRILAVNGARGAEAMNRAIATAQTSDREVEFELQDGRRLKIKPGDQV